jgi:hypothetical protein
MNKGADFGNVFLSTRTFQIHKTDRLLNIVESYNLHFGGESYPLGRAIPLFPPFSSPATPSCPLSPKEKV